MDGIRSSLGGCLLAGSQACEFCHGERCRRWSPGAGSRLGRRPGCGGPARGWERKELGAGISVGAEARPGQLPGHSPRAGKGGSCSLTLEF